MKWTRIWESVTSKVKEKIGEGGERFLLMILIGILCLIIGIPHGREEGQHEDNRQMVQSEELPFGQEQKIYGDKVFIVTVNVSYSRTANDTKKYDLELQSLKVIK